MVQSLQKVSRKDSTKNFSSHIKYHFLIFFIHNLTNIGVQIYNLKCFNNTLQKNKIRNSKTSWQKQNQRWFFALKIFWFYKIFTNFSDLLLQKNKIRDSKASWQKKTKNILSAVNALKKFLLYKLFTNFSYIIQFFYSFHLN